MRRLTFALGILFLVTVACMQVTWSQVATPTATVESSTPTATETPYPTATPAVTPVEFCTVATGLPDGALHLRSCGSVSCPVVAWLNEGQPVEIVESGDWSLVKAGIYTGYVYSEYIKSCTEVK